MVHGRPLDRQADSSIPLKTFLGGGVTNGLEFQLQFHRNPPVQNWNRKNSVTGRLSPTQGPVVDSVDQYQAAQNEDSMISRSDKLDKQ